jgi:cytochrome c peroxidase
VELGERLFFDKMLSSDYSISCSSCHIPAFAFADTAVFSLGVNGQKGIRNAPSSMNMAARPYFFYDGRSETIQEQVLVPIHNPIEMNLSILDLLNRLNSSPYGQWFVQLFGQKADSITLGTALAAYVFSLESPGDSDFDKWMYGDEQAMTAEQIAGREIFNEKGKCFDCHFGPDFTGDEFRNIGLYNGSPRFNEIGRFAITADSNDLGKMKVPGLRNVAVTAPYMHNGMFKTLEEVVNYYNEPSKFIQNSINADPLIIEPLDLSTEEKRYLVAFFRGFDRQYLPKQTRKIKTTLQFCLWMT